MRSGDFYIKPIEPDDFLSDTIPSMYVSGYFNMFSEKKVFGRNSNRRVDTFEEAIEKFNSIHEGVRAGVDFNYWIFQEVDKVKKQVIGNVRLIPVEYLIATGNEEYSWLEDYVGSIYKKMWVIEFTYILFIGVRALPLSL